MSQLGAVIRACAITLLCACGSGVASGGGEPSRSVTQGGPQDIGEFRRVVERGEVPAPSLLDEVGFFAEHAVDLPTADCGAAVCAHPMLAVAPRFDDGNWTMAFVALNTTADPTKLAQRPRHIIVVTTDSAPALELVGSWQAVLQPLSEHLTSTDIVSVFVAGKDSRLLQRAVAPSELDRIRIPTDPDYPPDEGLYGALAGALELAQDARLASFQQALVLLTDGRQIGTDPRIRALSDFEALAQRFAQQQVPITSIGLGTPTYERLIPAALAETTGGNYYFAANRADVIDAISVEAQTAFTPLATDLELTITAAAGYSIGNVFGASRAVAAGNQVTLASPLLFVGARTGASDTGSGRRGGGGGFFVQLVADSTGPKSAADAFQVGLSYRDVATRERAEQNATLSTPLGVGRNPPPQAPFFSDMTRAKPFMMLNMYLALRTVVQLYDQHGCGGARAVRDMMSQSYEYWHQMYSDPDIDADFALLQRLTMNIEFRCDEELYTPPAVELACFIF